MATRTLSIRVEVQVEVRDSDHLKHVKDRLVSYVCQEMREDPAVIWTGHGGAVTRRPRPTDGAL